uniref:Hcy-binding domain-containing protein n=1 Tax=Glossina palpalis gambiensis TaxID=67801 RepID=A0A1B0BLD3_9MUSC
MCPISELWIQLKAKIIGGCCRVSPEGILAICKCIDNIGTFLNFRLPKTIVRCAPPTNVCNICNLSITSKK